MSGIHISAKLMELGAAARIVQSSVCAPRGHSDGRLSRALRMSPKVQRFWDNDMHKNNSLKRTPESVSPRRALARK
jgi:hypothetical protein